MDIMDLEERIWVHELQEAINKQDALRARIAELEAERDELKSMLDWHVREPVPDGDPVQELGEYLADNLDEDKWNHVEPLLNGLRAALQDGGQEKP
jgi:hypothetical protein